MPINLNFLKKRPIWLGLLVLIIMVIVVLFVVSLILEVPPPEEIQVGEAVLPLASGKQTYDIRTDNLQNLMIIQVDIDPLDVKQGETQIVIVHVKDTENKPITQEDKVEAIAFTDNISFPFPLSLKKANGGPDSITTWEGSWVCEDTYDSRYMITIKAKKVGGEHSVDLSFR